MAHILEDSLIRRDGWWLETGTMTCTSHTDPNPSGLSHTDLIWLDPQQSHNRETSPGPGPDQAAEPLRAPSGSNFASSVQKDFCGWFRL